MQAGQNPVLVLGAGINGSAIARELLLNGVSVWLVDASDLACGATSGSSRLIHGGLRYLEYGELDLVKESLAERARLLKLAPQFVHPLRLWIPISGRFGGALGAIGRFFGWSWWPQPTPPDGRGVTLIRAGLMMYDAYARDPLLPKHVKLPAASSPLPIDRHKYRWACAYYDAQVVFPERLVVAMLEDARQLAAFGGLEFRMFNYHQASLAGKTVEIRPIGADGLPSELCALAPSAIINATGAWVDETLKRLHVASERLIGGTKGTHAFTFNPRLREALAGQGIYAEARDGRPIFITPLAESVLIGTTDDPFQGPPERALATPNELDYLLASVNAILPDVHLTIADVDFHYSAVRPLPYVHADRPAAITRRHALVKHDKASVPMYSVIGGKLTTMRSLAEQTAETVLQNLGRTHSANSRDRVFPGAEGYPADLDVAWRQIAERLGYSIATVAAVWGLVGTRTASILQSSPDRSLVEPTDLPCSFVRWSIDHEWVRTLADLVERRLMLLYDQRLTKACLRRLAEILSERGLLSHSQIDAAVAEQAERLRAHFGRHLT